MHITMKTWQFSVTALGIALMALSRARICAVEWGDLVKSSFYYERNSQGLWSTAWSTAGVFCKAIRLLAGDVSRMGTMRTHQGPKQGGRGPRRGQRVEQG
jgi:hypothetical protein